MKHRTVFFLVVACSALALSFCTSFPQSFFPVPTSTWTPWPTDTPRPNYQGTTGAKNEAVRNQARELAKLLSGEKAIDCGELEGTRDEKIIVNDCIVNAYQSKQAFRGFFVVPNEDWSDSFWLVGAPDRKYSLIHYQTGWLGPFGPETIACQKSIMQSELKVFICND